MDKNYSTNNFANNMASDIVVGLDIGTTKMATVIGYMNNKGKIEILGHGKSASKGVEFGVILNLLKAQENIRTSTQLACSHAHMDEIRSVYAGIAARHIRTANCKHYIFRSNHMALITQEELDMMKRDVEKIALPPDQRIITIIPQKYVIEDSADGASHESLDPVGEWGSKITGYYQIITGNLSEIQKIHTCITNVGIRAEELILEPIASGLSCLTEDEKNRGVALIDIGGGTTDMVIFQNGHPLRRLRHHQRHRQRLQHPGRHRRGTQDQPRQLHPEQKQPQPREHHPPPPRPNPAENQRRTTRQNHLQPRP